MEPERVGQKSVAPRGLAAVTYFVGETKLRKSEAGGIEPLSVTSAHLGL
jgi:hypothetical protein